MAALDPNDPTVKKPLPTVGTAQPGDPTAPPTTPASLPPGFGTTLSDGSGMTVNNPAQLQMPADGVGTPAPTDPTPGTRAPAPVVPDTTTPGSTLGAPAAPTIPTDPTGTYKVDPNADPGSTTAAPQSPDAPDTPVPSPWTPPTQTPQTVTPPIDQGNPVDPTLLLPNDGTYKVNPNADPGSTPSQASESPDAPDTGPPSVWTPPATAPVAPQPSFIPPPDGGAPIPPPTDTNGMVPGSSPAGIPGVLPSVGTFGPGNDLRYSTIDPTASARTTADQSATDAAAAKVAAFDPNAQIAQNVDQFGNTLATPDVGFTGVNTDVSRTAVDPTIAFNGVGTDVSAGPTIDPTDSPALAQYKAQQAAAAAAVGNGANRQTLAEQNLDAFDQSSAPAIQDAIRSVGQRAAALGRIGNGETSVEALKPYTDYLTQRSAMETQLAADTASGDIQDRQNNLTAAEGLVGSTSSQDANVNDQLRTERTNVQDTTASNLARQVAERNAQLGVESGNRTAAQQEADAQAATATGNVTRAMDQNTAATQNAQTNAARDAAAKAAAVSQGINAADLTGSTDRADATTASGVEGQSAAEDTNAQNALRTERTYQDQVSQEATQAAIQQHLLEQQDQAQGFNQAAETAALGQAGNPAGAIANAANTANANSTTDYAALQKMLQQYYAQQPQPAGG